MSLMSKEEEEGIVNRLERLETLVRQILLNLESKKDVSTNDKPERTNNLKASNPESPPPPQRPAIQRRHSSVDTGSMAEDLMKRKGREYPERERSESVGLPPSPSLNLIPEASERSQSLQHTLSSEQLRLARPPAVYANLVVPDANTIQRASVIAKARARAAIEAAAVKAAQTAAGQVPSAEETNGSGELEPLENNLELGVVNDTTLRKPQSTKNSQHKESQHWISVEHGQIPAYLKWYNKCFVEPCQLRQETESSRIALSKKQKLFLRPRLHTIIVHPDSAFLRGWNTLLGATVCMQLIVLPIGIGFPETSLILQIQSALLFPIWLLATFIDSITIKKEEGGNIIMNHAFLVKKYARSYLPLDIICRIPYPILIEAIAKDNANIMQLRLLYVFNIFAVLRNAIVGKNWFEHMEQTLRVHYNINSNISRTFAIILWMMLYWHWSSCIKNWIGFVFDEIGDESIVERYTYGVYSSAGEMLSAGFGVKPPVTVRDRWLTILNMLISSGFLALLVANITTVLTNLDSSGRMFKEKIDEVQQYISYKDLGQDLRGRILSYFEYKYSKGKLFDEGRILSELNAPLRKKISMHNCKALILKVPFFRDAGDAFIASVVTVLKVNHFLQGDFVIEEDTFGDEMYFIASGIVEVITNGKSRAKLHPGLFFGGDLDQVLSLYPPMESRMRAVATERLNQLKALKKAERESAKLKEALDMIGGSAGPSLPGNVPNRNTAAAVASLNASVAELSKQAAAAAMVFRGANRALNHEVKSTGYAGGNDHNVESLKSISAIDQLLLEDEEHGEEDWNFRNGILDERALVREASFRAEKK
ncbi:Potassium/sodium hyperpolarization-activated cyclic nucleotide-gated channel 4 [Phlyctochytrium planicorne]|nr:Potassium/sodium hyperpolarization-activated cyclic nucleotide-gated channel 4 [Phlyctochytrium planicorne]